MGGSMAEETILGTTTVSDRWRISLLRAVRDEFENGDGGVDVGDRLVYRRVDGKIIIEQA